MILKWKRVCLTSKLMRKIILPIPTTGMPDCKAVFWLFLCLCHRHYIFWLSDHPAICLPTCTEICLSVWEISRHNFEKVWNEWPQILHVHKSRPPSELIRFCSQSVDFPNFREILTKWPNFGFPSIIYKMHGRNGLKFGMLLYTYCWLGFFGIIWKD